MTTKTELINTANGNAILATNTVAPFDSFSWDSTGVTGSVSLAVRWYVDNVLVETSSEVGITVNAQAGDTTAPTITSATIEDAQPSNLVVVFSEVVNITDLTGISITGTGAPAINSVSGTGTNTLTFVLSAAATGGESWTLDVAGTNTITDNASNALAATTQAITNNAASTSYDPDYQAVLDYATANSIPLPTQAQQDADNQEMIDYKATGAWAKDFSFFKFKGTADPAFKLIDWKRLTQGIPIGGLTWTDNGLKGDGSTGYIKTGFIPSNTAWTTSNASVSFVLFDEGTPGDMCLLGGAVSSTAYTYINPNGGTTKNYRMINDNGIGSGSSSYSKLGYTQMDRISTDEIRIDDLNTFAGHPSDNLTTAELYLLARNVSGAASLFADYGVSYLRLSSNSIAEYSAIKTHFDG